MKLRDGEVYSPWQRLDLTTSEALRCQLQAYLEGGDVDLLCDYVEGLLNEVYEQGKLDALREG